MDKAKVNGVELEYEIEGAGETVLLIPNGPIAGCFRPFMSAAALASRYRLIRYHQRGQAGSTSSTTAISLAQHAADARALLAHVGARSAHVVGHSTGAAVALQLASDHPEAVHSLVLLEPTLPAAPAAGAFLEKAGPAIAAYMAGDREAAVAAFLSAVAGLDREDCRSVLERHVPGSFAQAVKDADFFFGSILPALNAWKFGPEQAARIAQPVLSLVGSETDEWFRDGDDMLHSWFPELEGAPIHGVGHLLHLQNPEPVVDAIAGFFARHPVLVDSDEGRPVALPR